MSEEEESDFIFSGMDDPKLDPFSLAIGKLSLAWAEFEFNVNDAIWELANVERKAGTCLSSQMIGPGPRFRCLIALLNLRGTPQEIIKAMNSLSHDAEGLGRQRNRYLHDPMVWHKKEGTVHRMEATADRTVKHGIVPVTLDDIKLLALQIDHIGAHFNFLYAHAVETTPAWPRAQFSESDGIRRKRQKRTPENTPPGLKFPPLPTSL